LICLSGLFAGCQIPAASVGGCAGGDRPALRLATHRRQVWRDSAIRITLRPLSSAKEVGCTRLNHWLNVGRGWTVCYSAPVEENPPGLDQGLKPAHLDLHPEGREALTALEQLIDQATCRLDVLTFIWGNDPVGEAIARRLAARASPQLPVRVLVDGGGNLLFGVPDKAPPAVANGVVCWLASQPYVQVIRVRNPGYHYDHRKLVIADDRVAWMGGRNFTERGFFRQNDLSVTLTGPLVSELAERFEAFWQEQGGTPAPPLPPSPAEVPTALARLITTDPPHLGLERTFYRAVAAAQHHVYLENYSLADPWLLHQLVQAQRRGVDVRVVTTLHCGTEITNRANRVIANQLMRAGVRVYLYPDMTHLKAMTVDGCWAYTGSANFDPLSLRRNHEIGLAIEAGASIRELEDRVLLPDLRSEWELREALPLTITDHLAALLTQALL
jgi:cardiolipin synthase